MARRSTDRGQDATARARPTPAVTPGNGSPRADDGEPEDVTAEATTLTDADDAGSAVPAPVEDGDGITVDGAVDDAAGDESAALRDQLLRLAADFENFRKRAAREQEDVRRYGIAQVLQDLLPVLDNLDRALTHSDGDAHPVVHGVRLVAKQFHDILGRFGVQSFPSVGVPFDPERHEAVAQVPTRDASPGTILEEMQRGYLLRDRLLRPARVVVASPLADTENAEQAD